MDLACLSSATGRFPLFGIVYTRHVKYNTYIASRVLTSALGSQIDQTTKTGGHEQATFGLIANGIPERTRNYVMRRR